MDEQIISLGDLRKKVLAGEDIKPEEYQKVLTDIRQHRTAQRVSKKTKAEQDKTVSIQRSTDILNDLFGDIKQIDAE